MNEKTPVNCPECRSTEITNQPYEGDMLAPECDYWLCENCDHQWGHE